jgi:hypothetical protein
MSNPVIESLKAKLKVSLRYFSQVLHVGIEGEAFRVPLIMGMSEHSIVFLDSKFGKFLGEVFYAHLAKLVLQKDLTSDVLRLEYDDHRPEGIPKKMTFITPDKVKIIQYLKCCWETDYIWRLSKVFALPVEYEYIDISRYKQNIIPGIGLFIDRYVVPGINKNIYLHPPKSYKKVKLKGYCFFINSFFTNIDSTGRYLGVYDKEAYDLTVNVYDVKLLELIKSDLRFITESIAESFIEPDEDYYYLSDSLYIKKSNLVMDLAKWEGWEVELETPVRHISVIFLRRKFIPPMMDSGQDFSLICKGDKRSRKCCADIADSIHTLGISNEVYKTILSQRCDGLIMNREIAEFYQNKFNIKPNKVHFGYQLIMSILSIIDKYVDNKHFKKIIKTITAKFDIKGSDKAENKLQEPFGIVEAYCKSCFLDYGTLSYRIWCTKVYRYLSYCIDGGLTHNKVLLKDILVHLKTIKLETKDTENINYVLSRLLDIKESGSLDEYDEIPTGIQKMLEKTGFTVGEKNSISSKQTLYKRWSFNTEVMGDLIQTGYLKKLIESTGEPNEYYNLLIYLLQTCASAELKSIIFGSLMQSDPNRVQVFMPALIDAYTGKNYVLATRAAMSLATLTANNRENKEHLYKYNETIINRLLCKDVEILCYTISILLNLSSNASRRKMISKASSPYILSIIKAERFTLNYIPLIQKSFQLLSLFCKDPINIEYYINNQEFLASCIRYIGKDHECDLKIYFYFESLCEKNQAARNVLGEKCIGKIVDQLQGVPGIEVVKRILSLVKSIVRNNFDENYKISVEKGLPKILNGMLKNTTLSRDSAILQQISELKKIFE